MLGSNKVTVSLPQTVHEITLSPQTQNGGDCYARKLQEPVPDSNNTYLSHILVYEIFD
jgi:hypothetical protein